MPLRPRAPRVALVGGVAPVTGSGGITVSAATLSGTGTCAPPDSAAALTPESLMHAHEFGVAALTTAAVLAAAELTHTHTISATALSAGTTLAPASVAHAHIQEIPLLPQGWPVLPVSVTHGQSFDAAALVYKLTIDPDAIYHEQPISLPNLTRGSTLGLTPEQVWEYEIVPGVSAAKMLRELWLMHGLDSNNPLHVAQTSRQVADIAQTISEQSGTVTITRQ